MMRYTTFQEKPYRPRRRMRRSWRVTLAVLCALLILSAAIVALQVRQQLQSGSPLPHGAEEDRLISLENR